MSTQDDVNKIVSFLVEKRTNTVCEICGVTNWALKNEQGVPLELNIPLAQTDGFQIPPPAVPVYAVICLNCGNTRLHAKAVVRPDLMER